MGFQNSKMGFGNFENKIYRSLARGFATKLMAIILIRMSLGLPSHKENKINSIKLVSFPNLLQVVVEY
jgi:hypothetical protein